MTGMDMPFSSPTGAASVARVPSNTGGFGGVMLHAYVQTVRPYKNNTRNSMT